LSLRRRSPPAPQARQDGLDVPGEGADEHRSVEPYTVRNTSRISVCRTPVEHQAVLFSTSSLGILSSVVAISVTSRRRPLAPSVSALRIAKTTQRAVAGEKQTLQTHSSRIERRAARRGGGTGAGERRPARAGEMGEAGSALEMRRLEAPVRDKPGIDQHQRRALH